MRKVAVRLLVVLGLAAVSQGYSGGAPEGVCSDMTPRHDTEAQASKSPYTIRVSKSKIRAGESVDVTISGKKGLKFKGVFLQGRVGETAVGKFDIKPQYQDFVKHVNCFGGTQNAVTHTNSLEKSEITVTWIAPPNLKELVVFYATVAKNGGEFWVKQKSRSVSVS